MNYSRLQNYFGTFEYVSIYVLYIYLYISFYIGLNQTIDSLEIKSYRQDIVLIRKGYLLKKYRCSYIIAPSSQFIILGAIPQ